MDFAGISDMKVPFCLETLLERTAQELEQGRIQPLQTEPGVIGQLELATCSSPWMRLSEAGYILPRNSVMSGAVQSTPPTNLRRITPFRSMM
jgi:hypothetical protein